MPELRTACWQEKFERNVSRDRRYEQALREAGWNVFVIWECETRKADALEERLLEFFGAAARRQRSLTRRPVTENAVNAPEPFEHKPESRS